MRVYLLFLRVPFWGVVYRKPKGKPRVLVLKYGPPPPIKKVVSPWLPFKAILKAGSLKEGHAHVGG